MVIKQCADLVHDTLVTNIICWWHATSLGTQHFNSVL